MNDYLLDLIEEHRCAKEDLRYLKDFIHYRAAGCVLLLNSCYHERNIMLKPIRQNTGALFR